MTEITKCLNEWNAIIEALGQGKQSILIRKYSTTLNQFLLYPTKTYSTKENYLDFFKKEYRTFVKENLLPNSDKNKKYEVKYLAKVVSVKTVTNRFGRFDNYHIWNKKHISSYFKNKKANLWLLRIYKLDEPQYLSRSHGITYANVNKEINIDNISPVVSDDDFEDLKKDILNKF
ncbi:MAG: DUF1802 family protein [Methanobacteriaceae archaeon]|nr:DUF1802 family protein [Methanobacteriaceae archaeon]